MFVFFLMIRRPPRSTQGRSSAASDVYKRQVDSRGVPFRLDKCVRTDSSSEKLAGLPPVFRQDGILTAGNSSKISDGCLLYTSPSPRDSLASRMPSSA